MSSRSETSLIESKYVPSQLKWLIIVAGVLVFLGALNIYSATYYMNLEEGKGAYFHIIRHTIFLAVSLLSAYLCARLPMTAIRKFTPVLSLIVFLFLILVPIIGVNVNGATRWIFIAGISIQPSEFAKVAAVLWTASLLAFKVDKRTRITFLPRLFKLFLMGNTKKGNPFFELLSFMTPLYVPLFMAILVLFQPDMGTAGMILLFPVLLYIICGLPVYEIVLGAGVSALGFILLAIMEPYRWDRVMVLWDPFSHMEGKGYQTVQSLIAVGSGGFLGQGIGEGMSKFLYLPEQFTDFAFAVFSQEFGFIGAAFVLFLYVLFLFLGFHVAKILKYTYAQLVVYGLTMLIAVEGMVNIAMVIGSFPVTGIPLPFISYGGSSLLTNMCALGIIYGTATHSIKQWDLEERRRRINAMEGRRVSLGELSGAVFRTRVP